MSYLNRNDPAVLWYPKDFLADTQVLSNEEIGILMRFKALFFSHGRIERKTIERSIGAIPDSLNNLILTDSNNRLYCPELERIIKERKEHSARKSKDGKLGNEVKAIMKEKGCSSEEARRILEKEKGYTFGKDKCSMPSDTPSERNKGNAIGNRNSSLVDSEPMEIMFKRDRGEELNNYEKEILIKIETGEIML